MHELAKLKSWLEEELQKIHDKIDKALGLGIYAEVDGDTPLDPPADPIPDPGFDPAPPNPTPVTAPEPAPAAAESAIAEHAAPAGDGA